MPHPDRCPYCGSISEGTLKPEDLIPAFAEALAIRLEELEKEQQTRNRSSGEEKGLDIVELYVLVRRLARAAVTWSGSSAKRISVA